MLHIGLIEVQNKRPAWENFVCFVIRLTKKLSRVDTLAKP